MESSARWAWGRPAGMGMRKGRAGPISAVNQQCRSHSEDHAVLSLNTLLIPLAHLDQVLRAVGGDLLNHLAATDRLYSDLGVELGAVGAAFASG